MTHLHIPDGVLPWRLWAPAWIAALVVLGLSARASRGLRPREVATRGALGALVIAAMSLAVPLGPLEYHLSLLGPLGVLLGAGAAYEVLFVVSAILAFAGHGGLTVVGLNALVLGCGAMVARPLYRALAAHRSAAASLALAAAMSQAVAGSLWVVVMLVALRFGIARANAATLPWITGLVVALWIVGILVESAVAFGAGRLLARVRPELLPPPAFGGRASVGADLAVKP